jgi:hypothetical protein
MADAVSAHAAKIKLRAPWTTTGKNFRRKIYLNCRGVLSCRPRTWGGACMVDEPVPVATPGATASADGTGDSGNHGRATPVFSQRMIDLGFLTGLLLAIACLMIAGWYLISYQHFASEALRLTVSDHPPSGPALGVHIYLARALLQSCGLATGMAFGFLGFSLFLLGVSGSMDASATGGGQLGIQVARISPGAFVMLCAAILVGLCATSDIPARMEGGVSRDEGTAGNEIEASDAADRYGTIDPNLSSEEAAEMNRVEQLTRTGAAGDNAQ